MNTKNIILIGFQFLDYMFVLFGVLGSTKPSISFSHMNKNIYFHDEQLCKILIKIN